MSFKHSLQRYPPPCVGYNLLEHPALVLKTARGAGYDGVELALIPRTVNPRDRYKRTSTFHFRLKKFWTGRTTTTLAKNVALPVAIRPSEDIRYSMPKTRSTQSL